MKWLVSIGVAIGLGLLGREGWASLPGLSRAVLRLVTLALPSSRRALRRKEWLAELATEYDERRLAGLVWAFCLVGPSVWERMTSLGPGIRVAYTLQRRLYPVARDACRTALGQRRSNARTLQARRQAQATVRALEALKHTAEFGHKPRAERIIRLANATASPSQTFPLPFDHGDGFATVVLYRDGDAWTAIIRRGDIAPLKHRWQTFYEERGDA
jgi:hypothetical protein